MKKRVLAILTGGTIASAVGDGSGALPNKETSSRLEDLLQHFYHEKNIAVEIMRPWGSPGYDSSDIGPLQWLDLTRIVVEEYQKGDLEGVIILHGTDTMAYTASWLSLALRNIPVPVILTGSQLTLDYTPEDVLVNLRGAAQVICTSTTGVWIYFNWKLLPGGQAHKARATHPDAFIVQNGVPIFFNPEWAAGKDSKGEYPSDWKPPQHTLSLLYTVFTEKNIHAMAETFRWIFCAPGIEPVFSAKEKIVAILGFGSGNAPQDTMRSIARQWSGAEKPSLFACSQAEGDRKKPDAYGDVGIASLCEEGFSVWNQGENSLEFMHALGWYALLGCPENPGEILEQHLQKM